MFLVEWTPTIWPYRTMLCKLFQENRDVEIPDPVIWAILAASNTSARQRVSVEPSRIPTRKLARTPTALFARDGIMILLPEEGSRIVLVGVARFFIGLDHEFRILDFERHLRGLPHVWFRWVELENHKLFEVDFRPTKWDRLLADSVL